MPKSHVSAEKPANLVELFQLSQEKWSKFHNGNVPFTGATKTCAVKLQHTKEHLTNFFDYYV